MERKIFGQQPFWVFEIGRDLTLAGRKNYGNKRGWYNIQPCFICVAALISQDSFQLMSKTGVSYILPQRNLWEGRQNAKRYCNLKIEGELWNVLCKEWQWHTNFTSNWKSGENLQLLTSLLQMRVSIVDIQIVRNEENNSFVNKWMWWSIWIARRPKLFVAFDHWSWSMQSLE